MPYKNIKDLPENVKSPLRGFGSGYSMKISIGAERIRDQTALVKMWLGYPPGPPSSLGIKKAKMENGNLRVDEVFLVG